MEIPSREIILWESVTKFKLNTLSVEYRQVGGQAAAARLLQCILSHLSSNMTYRKLTLVMHHGLNDIA